jgi:hypothetical protein
VILSGDHAEKLMVAGEGQEGKSISKIFEKKSILFHRNVGKFPCDHLAFYYSINLVRGDNR